MKSSKILEMAAHIVADGWCKKAHTIKHPDGTVSHCLLGAIDTATKVSAGLWSQPAAEAAYAYTKLFHDNPVQWNDAESTKKQEVIDVLLHAAACAEMEGK